ncbi:MAG: ribosome biogenesis GTPase Der [Flavobacteriales bacterium]|nr:ribosome biogenesis GTPase Der [Flavobacteriales bacterium]
MRNIVAIVGRPNVGKSTLFNRLTQRRQAIVDSVSGVTRDRHYGISDWNGRDFTVIDTGGYITGSEDVFEAEIRKQVKIAVEESDCIIFVVDVETGTTDLDMDVAQILRKANKPVFIAVNKVDNAMRMDDAMEFYNLGLGEYFPISSINGSGTGDLLDAVVNCFSKEDEPETDELPKFAIIGRPNAGKSSLVNALMGKNKNIVTNIAGTTRDSIDTHYNQFGHEFTLVDTAGLRKKAKVHENLEFYSVMRTIRAIEHSDVCIVMVDATIGFDAQDLNIFHLAEKNNKGIVVLVNKWDLVENKETMTMEHYRKMILTKTAPFTDYPIIFISATTKQRIFKAIEMAVEVYNRKTTKISTSELNNSFLPITENTPPPSYKGKYVKIKYITQIPTMIPSFAFFCNLPQYVKDPYKRFIENKFRDIYDLHGVPIRIYFRKK